MGGGHQQKKSFNSATAVAPAYMLKKILSSLGFRELEILPLHRALKHTNT
jgi:hypothetical protein